MPHRVIDVHLAGIAGYENDSVQRTAIDRAVGPERKSGGLGTDREGKDREKKKNQAFKRQAE
jgi:hypothetical protein